MKAVEALQPWWGKSDESAFALAALATRIGRIVDPSLLEWQAPATLVWDKTIDGYTDPILCRAEVGRVALIAEYELQDGISGPRDIFRNLYVLIRGLPEGWIVSLKWNGARELSAILHVPSRFEAEARTLLEGVEIWFENKA